jgi:hypothetical protein
MVLKVKKSVPVPSVRTPYLFRLLACAGGDGMGYSWRRDNLKARVTVDGKGECKGRRTAW